MSCEHIIVTRHYGLAKYILDKGIAPAGTPVVRHAKPQDVRGKHVYGVIPLRLAHLAVSVTEIPLFLEGEDHVFRDIPYERVCKIAQDPVVLKATVISGAYRKPNQGKQSLSG